MYKALKPDGLFVQQTESPFYHKPLITKVYHDISGLFPITKMYLANIPLYPGGSHSFTMGSKQVDPTTCALPARMPFSSKYYNLELHRSCFVLPNFVRSLLESE